MVVRIRISELDMHENVRMSKLPVTRAPGLRPTFRPGSDSVTALSSSYT